MIRTGIFFTLLAPLFCDPWRRDGRCGPRFPLPDGSPAECHPISPDSCCNQATGWCGRTPQHCECDVCFDFRNPSYCPTGSASSKACDTHLPGSKCQISRLGPMEQTALKIANQGPSRFEGMCGRSDFQNTKYLACSCNSAEIVEVEVLQPLCSRGDDHCTRELGENHHCGSIYSFEDGIYGYCQKSNGQQADHYVKCQCDEPVNPWRPDGRCGQKFPLPDGTHSECDPFSDTPCCSESGWCSRGSPENCDCPECRDYREIQFCDHSLCQEWGLRKCQVTKLDHEQQTLRKIINDRGEKKYEGTCGPSINTVSDFACNCNGEYDRVRGELNICFGGDSFCRNELGSDDAFCGSIRDYNNGTYGYCQSSSSLQPVSHMRCYCIELDIFDGGVQKIGVEQYFSSQRAIKHRVSTFSTWRQDGRCGPDFPLPDGIPSECHVGNCLPSGYCDRYVGNPLYTGTDDEQTMWLAQKVDAQIVGGRTSTPIFSTYRSDGRCGSNFPLPDGSPSECSPIDGETPCCSPDGYCGTVSNQCHVC